MAGILFPDVQAPDLHVMSFNVRRRFDRVTWPPADRWPMRKQRLRTFLGANRPHLLGSQEAMPDQARWVQDSLGSTYGRLGLGRGKDRGGEGTPLFYDRDRVEVDDWQQVALSDTPDEPGSTGWGNTIPRIAVIAQLRDRATGARFTFVNTHFDAFSRRARRRSATWLHDLVASHEGPLLFTADVNAHVRSGELAGMFADGLLVDTWSYAPVRHSAEWGTFNNYAAPRVGARRIDALLATPDVGVRAVGIDPRPTGTQWPSDHLPVQAVVRIPVGSAP
ncbi:Metal-dependent hydrolase, endonuclease/exonuclease/phosphatase family [Microbacterium sp. ru370.1]|uniref:endonuclease/exonuclease/phosphatase family protein n=1 Tax=unclassified Microbacterium TaxID=2609290 RepID=UPI000881131B|nr:MULTISPECIES: endonuclease/exonuclease/phosphatase family protein [unclassified Microbacterium]SDO62131.1 Metal-dependent hydrolase, endonuclease/exonuclease/phosphatase family [Microbacterium sp. ru370.1]SIT86548.1 Metal-dependent hydrolase, endonuclease/exonuclease/phosphatase family [Microbacterium sp. RU1D]